MAAALTSLVATRPAGFCTQQQRPSSRRQQRCAATVEDEKRTLDFGNNKRSALGYTENDSAGQTNIFAVEPKTYVAGSSADKTQGGSQATFIVAGIAALAAAAAVGGGLLANSGPAALVEVAPAADQKTLSAYAAQFAAEQAPAPAAAPELSN